MIDEYTLAAFLAGSLSEEERTHVIAQLAHDPELREAFVLAAHALDALTPDDQHREERAEPADDYIPDAILAPPPESIQGRSH